MAKNAGAFDLNSCTVRQLMQQTGISLGNARSLVCFRLHQRRWAHSIEAERKALARPSRKGNRNRREVASQNSTAGGSGTQLPTHVSVATGTDPIHGSVATGTDPIHGSVATGTDPIHGSVATGTDPIHGSVATGTDPIHLSVPIETEQEESTSQLIMRLGNWDKQAKPHLQSPTHRENIKGDDETLDFKNMDLIKQRQLSTGRDGVILVSTRTPSGRVLEDKGTGSMREGHAAVCTAPRRSARLRLKRLTLSQNSKLVETERIMMSLHQRSKPLNHGKATRFQLPILKPTDSALQSRGECACNLTEESLRGLDSDKRQSRACDALDKQHCRKHGRCSASPCLADDAESSGNTRLVKGLVDNTQLRKKRRSSRNKFRKKSEKEEMEVESLDFCVIQ